MFGMKRRDFITLLGGAAAAWPLAARAQQPLRMRRIGVLMYGDENDYDQKARLSGFMQSLAKSGWADSRNLLIDVRWTAANLDLVRKHAKELVALKPEQTSLQRPNAIYGHKWVDSPAQQSPTAP